MKICGYEAMLDFSPQSQNIRAAAAAMDRILYTAHAMTVASSTRRRQLFQKCKAPIDELLALNEEHFGGSPQIRGNIALLAKSLVTLRNLGDGQILEDRSDGEGLCPYCATPITKYQPQYDPKSDDPYLIYCNKCSDIYIRAISKLDMPTVGFGTDAI